MIDYKDFIPQIASKEHSHNYKSNGKQENKHNMAMIKKIFTKAYI